MVDPAFVTLGSVPFLLIRGLPRAAALQACFLKSPGQIQFYTGTETYLYSPVSYHTTNNNVTSVALDARIGPGIQCLMALPYRLPANITLLDSSGNIRLGARAVIQNNLVSKNDASIVLCLRDTAWFLVVQFNPLPLLMSLAKRERNIYKSNSEIFFPRLSSNTTSKWPNSSNHFSTLPFLARFLLRTLIVHFHFSEEIFVLSLQEYFCLLIRLTLKPFRLPEMSSFLLRKVLTSGCLDTQTYAGEHSFP